MPNEVILKEDSEIKKNKMLVFAKTLPSNLSVPAQRVFLALLSAIKENEKGNQFYIKGKDIAALTGLPANVVGQQLKEMSIDADELRQYTLVIREDDGNDLRVGIISSTKYFKGERTLRVSVDSALLPYLTGIQKQWDISYSTAGAMKFRSQYSVPLYDRMNYYLAEGSHYYTVAEVRELFNIPEGKITRTSVLNQRVIAPAIDDINSFTNLEVSVQQHKKNNKTIIGYTFFVEDKNLKEAKKLEANNTESFIFKLISPPYEFNEKILFKLIDKYGIESVKNNFEYVSKRKTENFSKYLYWAITNQIYERTREIEQIQESDKSYGIDKLAELNGQMSLLEDPYQNDDSQVKYDDFDIEKIQNPELKIFYKKIMETKNTINIEKMDGE